MTHMRSPLNIPHHTFCLATVAILCGILLLPALPAPCATVNLTELRITFPATRQIKVHGKVRCTDLETPGAEVVVNSLSVAINYIEAGGRFPVLPEWFTPPQFYGLGDDILTAAQAQGSNAYTAYAFEKEISSNVSDNGREFSFDKTITVPDDRKPSEYRIVATLKHDYRKIAADPNAATSPPVHATLSNEVHGPFPWGVFPGVTPRVTDDMILTSTTALTDDLVNILRLQDVKLSISATQVSVNAAKPTVEAEADLTPIITYTLVSSALNAPWVDEISVILTEDGESAFTVEVSREIVDSYTNGTIGITAFVNAWQLSDPAPEMPPTPEELLLSGDRVPEGWLASIPTTVAPAKIVPILADTAGSLAVVPNGAALQTLQIGVKSLSIVVLTFAAPSDAEAVGRALQAVENAVQNEDGSVTLPSIPPLHAVTRGNNVYLISGTAVELPQVVDLLR